MKKTKSNGFYNCTRLGIVKIVFWLFGKAKC